MARGVLLRREGVYLGRIKRGLRRNPLMVVALAFIGALAITAIFAPVISPLDPDTQNLSLRHAPPGSEAGGIVYQFGTDQLGRDVLSRTIHGSRISLIIGVAATLLSGSLGLLIGLSAGFFGGKLDTILMRLADVQLAFPTILLLLTLVAVVGPGLMNVIILLGISGWVTYARVVRAEVLSLREREFVVAASTVGAGKGRILRRHILPNVLAPALTIATLQV